MVLAKENSILEWRDLLGPTSSHRARETHPERWDHKMCIEILFENINIVENVGFSNCTDYHLTI